MPNRCRCNPARPHCTPPLPARCHARCRYEPEQGGVSGSGSFDACADLAAQLLPTSAPGAASTAPANAAAAAGGAAATAASAPAAAAAAATPCKFERCSIGGEYLPRLAGVYMATENFHYAARVGGWVTVHAPGMGQVHA